MSNAQHTPGPWRQILGVWRGATNKTKAPRTVIRGAGDALVCVIESGASFDDIAQIAASSELLTAAEFFMENGNCKESRDLFRAAIAKAKGQA